MSSDLQSGVFLQQTVVLHCEVLSLLLHGLHIAVWLLKSCTHKQTVQTISTRNTWVWDLKDLFCRSTNSPDYSSITEPDLAFRISGPLCSLVWPNTARWDQKRPCDWHILPIKRFWGVAKIAKSLIYLIYNTVKNSNTVKYNYNFKSLLSIAMYFKM